MGARMKRFSRRRFTAAVILVILAGGTGSAAFAATAQEAPRPARVGGQAPKGELPPPGPAATDTDEARTLAPPAGYERLVESSETYTFDEAVAAADALNELNPAPAGQQYLYGLTPDGSFGVIAVCFAREVGLDYFPPEMRDRLESVDISDEGVQSWDCEWLYAKSAEPK
ncbi:MAG: hypothetical protein R2695_07635 [Acidimicrobiales bacterium]